MEVTLVSRYFDTRNRGAGSHSKLIYDGLSQKNIKLNQISQENSLISSYSPLSYLFYSAIDLKHLVNKKQYKNTDIFHALTPLECLYLPKEKSVASVLDLIPLNETESLKSSIFAKYFNKAIESAVKCERLVVNNSDLKKILVSDYGAEESDIDVISPPIEGKYYPIKKDGLLDKFNIKEDTFTVGTISNLMPRKRVDILLKSFLEADIENSKLLIGGGGPENKKLEKMANGDERIEFLGFVKDEDMNDFYNVLDVFAFPSLIEGYGMPIVEAMACGKPVITLDDSNIPSTLKEKTFVCKSEELTDVLVNRTYFCDIKRNIEFFKEHSIENIASKLMMVYESL